MESSIIQEIFVQIKTNFRRSTYFIFNHHCHYHHYQHYRRFHPRSLYYNHSLPQNQGVLSNHWEKLFRPTQPWCTGSSNSIISNEAFSKYEEHSCSYRGISDKSMTRFFIFSVFLNISLLSWSTFPHKIYVQKPLVLCPSVLKFDRTYQVHKKHISGQSSSTFSFLCGRMTNFDLNHSSHVNQPMHSSDFHSECIDSNALSSEHCFYQDSVRSYLLMVFDKI